MWNLVEDRLLTRLRRHPGVRGLAAELEREVRAGAVTATSAAERILDAFGASD